MQEQGLRWHLMREIEERGAEAVVADAISEALDGPDAIYLSIDIDVLDPGMAPGTGTPEPGGLLTRELLRAVRQIVSAVDLAAMDVVEVSPPYDHAETTSMAANRTILEAISALAVKRRDGRSVRHLVAADRSLAAEPAVGSTPEAEADDRTSDGRRPIGADLEGVGSREADAPRPTRATPATKR